MPLPPIRTRPATADSCASEVVVALARVAWDTPKAPRPALVRPGRCFSPAVSNIGTDWVLTPSILMPDRHLVNALVDWRTNAAGSRGHPSRLGSFLVP
ncbi:hypothetical protein ACFFX0_30815 [Citricoccus parietis]|uniref:Uncharacterized protein n=1 Tax=Citricoccus parietis TaxID=592307 RepID=A0ABV5G8N6_9MICC